MYGTWLVFSRLADKAIFFCTVVNKRSRNESTSSQALQKLAVSGCNCTV